MTDELFPDGAALVIGGSGGIGRAGWHFRSAKSGD